MPPFPFPFVQAAANVTTGGVFAGQRGFTSVMFAAGVYTLTLDTEIDAAQSVAIATLQSGADVADVAIDVRRPSDSVVEVRTRAAGALTNLAFGVAVLPLPVAG